MSDTESQLVEKPEVDFTKLPLYDDVQVRKLLAVLPDSIYKAGRLRDQAKVEYDKLKQQLKVETAKMHLVARANKDLTSNDDRKAWVSTRPSIIALENKIIEADGKVTAAELSYERYDNWFTSVRKVATMLTEIEKMIDYTNKYRGQEPPT